MLNPSQGQSESKWPAGHLVYLSPECLAYLSFQPLSSHRAPRPVAAKIFQENIDPTCRVLHSKCLLSH